MDVLSPELQDGPPRSAPAASRWLPGQSALRCAAVGVAVALILGVFGPPGVDRPAHLFQTWAYAHFGLQIWNNYWYAGRYQFVTYSLLFYPAASVLGITTVAIGSAGLMCGGFAAFAEAQWGRASRAPALVFAASATAVLMVFGMYPFLTGLSLGMLALVAAKCGRWLVFGLCATASAAASPLAFLMLVVALVTRVASAARPLGLLRRHRRPVVVIGLLLGLGAVWAKLFATGSFYAYPLSDLMMAVAFTTSGLYLTGLRGPARDLRTFFVLYMTVNAVAFLVPSPVGSNAIRLLTVGGAPILWIAARTTRRRPGSQVAVIVVTCLCVQVAPAVADAYYADHQPAASPAFWAPVLRFLGSHRRPVARVEVVATWGHWEAYYLAKDGVSLARGWYRQDDYPQNRVLYGGDELTARTYQRWLHRLGVRYVLLPAGALDYSATAESALLRSGRSGLAVVERLPNWTIFRVPRPTPMLTPTSSSGAASVTKIGPAAVRIRVTRPGSFLLRVRFTPYWHTPAGVCVGHAGNGMTILSASTAGAFSLSIEGSVTAMESAIAGDAGGCLAAPSRGG